MKLASKNVKFSCLAVVLVALSGCISEGDRALIQSYATQAGVSFAEAESSMRTVQGALKNLGFYQGRINGVPSVETNEAMQAYVNEKRKKTNSRVTGAPRASEIAKLISDYKEFLDSLNSGSNDSKSDSGFSADMENRYDSYSSTPVSVSNASVTLTRTVSDSLSAQSSISASSNTQPSSGGGSAVAGSPSSHSHTIAVDGTLTISDGAVTVVDIDSLN